jgi:hypothetical protein
MRTASLGEAELGPEPGARSSKRARVEAPTPRGVTERRSAHGTRAGVLGGGALGGGGRRGWSGCARLALLPLQQGVGSRETFARRSREAVAARLRGAAWREVGFAGAASDLRRGVTAVTWAGPDEALLAVGDELGGVTLLRGDAEEPRVLQRWSADGAATQVLWLQAMPHALLVVGTRQVAKLALGGCATTPLYSVDLMQMLESAVSRMRRHRPI